MKKLLSQIASAILGLYLAQRFIEGVAINAAPNSFWQNLLLIGLVLGLINFFIKLPLNFLTLGLFSFALNILTIWIADLLFVQLKIEGFLPLLWTTIIIFILTFISKKIW